MTQLAGKIEEPQPLDQTEVMKELIREVFNNFTLDDEYWASWRHRAWEVIRP